MQDLEDFLRGLAENNETQDVTRYTREVDGQDVTDFEIREKTLWSANGLPETVREYRSLKVLDCSHMVSKETPYAGICKCKKCQKHKPKESCANCLQLCSLCATPVCVTTCASVYEEGIACKPCLKKHKVKHVFSVLIAIIWRPFEDDGHEDD